MYIGDLVGARGVGGSFPRIIGGPRFEAAVALSAYSVILRILHHFYTPAGNCGLATLPIKSCCFLILSIELRDNESTDTPKVPKKVSTTSMRDLYYNPLTIKKPNCLTHFLHKGYVETLRVRVSGKNFAQVRI